ncbi:hypothetical protein [Streptomyces sp. SYSU K21746]
MPEPVYPHLGWNPAPGSATEIGALHTKLSASATSLGTAHRLIDRLLGESAYWQGEAADAFRDAIDGDLPRYLRNAHRSVSKAAKQLHAWHEDLVGYQALARKYEAQAKEHRAAVATAESTHATAATHPDLTAPDPSAAAAASRTLDAATASVTRARAALESVRKLARELEETHRAEASRIAKALNEATDRLAPREPGALSEFVDWMVEDLSDILSGVSAIAGFAGLVLSAVFPPVGLALLIVATGTSLAALVLHASDPKIRKSLTGGFTKGEFGSEFWKSTVTLTGDALGAVPGVAAVAQGAKAGCAAARTASAVPDAAMPAIARAGAREFTGASKSAMEELRDIDNPLTGWALRHASSGVQQTAKYGLPATGAATAIGGFTSLDENDTYSHTATAVDGARNIIDDGPSNVAKAAHAWAALRP